MAHGLGEKRDRTNGFKFKTTLRIGKSSSSRKLLYQLLLTLPTTPLTRAVSLAMTRQTLLSLTIGVMFLQFLIQVFRGG